MTKSPASPELWYWHHCFLATDQAVDTSKALIDKAAAAGYTGVALWDSGFNFMSDSFWPVENENRMREVLKYAWVKHHMKTLALVAPFGYSNDVLEANPNWAEAQRIVGARFQVDSTRKQLRFKNSFPGLTNSGFESGKTAWFDTNDAGIGINEVAHAGKSAAVIVDAPGNARLRQRVSLQPWREYHLRLFFKSSNFRGGPMVELLDKSDSSLVLFSANISTNGTHDWTQLDYTFNSRDTTDAYLYLGVWGGSSGILWFDDVQVEETALVYVARRAGTPLKAYDPNHAETVYREGVDFNPIADPLMASPSHSAFSRLYHDPPVVTLPPGTHLRAGQTVTLDFYAVFPIPNANEVGMCLTDPGVRKWLLENARAIKRILTPDAGLFLQYDEMRQVNSCAECRAKKMSAGQLLGWNVAQSIQLYKTEFPGAQLYIWNDMFDPYHNARNHYYYVEGDLSGSWAGLSRDVIIMNWHLDDLKNSLRWFSGLDARQPIPHSQIIAGYYDKGNGTAAAREELSQAAGIPGVLGFMYTTYNDDYSQLQSFAAAAKANWNAYLLSVQRAK